MFCIKKRCSSVSQLILSTRSNGQTVEYLSSICAHTSQRAVVLLFFRDVTDRHNAKKRAHENAEGFEAAVRRFADGLWTNDAGGRMSSEQLGWAELTGQSFENYVVFLAFAFHGPSHWTDDKGLEFGGSSATFPSPLVCCLPPRMAQDISMR